MSHKPGGQPRWLSGLRRSRVQQSQRVDRLRVRPLSHRGWLLNEIMHVTKEMYNYQKIYIIIKSIITQSIITQYIITQSIITQSIITQYIITHYIITQYIITQYIITQYIITQSIITQYIITQYIITQSFIIVYEN